MIYYIKINIYNIYFYIYKNITQVCILFRSSGVVLRLIFSNVEISGWETDADVPGGVPEHSEKKIHLSR